MSRGLFTLHGRAGALAAMTIAGMMMIAPAATAQTSNGQPSDQPAGTTTVDTAPGAGQIKESKAEKKADKLVQSKDTRKELRSEKKTVKKDSLAGLDKNAPDKELFDKAQAAIKSGHYDVARLDLQVMLNTYPDSQYQMQAKLAVADSWFKEGGTAALDQAEAEYKDFITFFPNTPEAAEAQMRVGDIYFREMDKPDRDDAKAQGAEREYRLMLQQFPDAPKDLIAQATQRLRDVQEMLAIREAQDGEFYAGHENRGAAIAHFKTVVDTYPLYSHMDEVLIALGDQYEAQAHAIRLQPLPEGAKAILEKENHDRAEAAYDQVVLEHAASQHVEDAKDRLAAMARPIPVPTPEQLAASTALENSRSSYTITDRAALLFLHRPDVVQAARIGAPPLTDPRPTLAPDVITQFRNEYMAALKGIAVPAPGTSTGEAKPVTPASSDAPAASGSPTGTLTLEDVPTAKVSDNRSSTTTVMGSAATSSSGSRTGTGVGLSIVTPTGPDSTPAASGTAPSTPAGTPASTPAGMPPMSSVGPTDNKPLPPIQKADAAPDQVNEIQPGATQGTTNTTASKNKSKKPKNAPVDSKNESSSKKKPKKGLDKLNPF